MKSKNLFADCHNAVDCDYCFTSIGGAYLGLIHDARAYRNSALPEKLNDLMVDDIPLYVLCDSAYPLSRRVIKNYPTEETQIKRKFNKKMNKIRVLKSLVDGARETDRF